jgi:radical SAM-linked protein
VNTGRLRCTFSKRGLAVFISHLDLMRLFQRSARRANLPVALTKGFNPHLKISITKALKLGKESDSLEAVFDLDSKVDPEKFKAALNAELPEGIEIKEVNYQC